MTVNAKKDYLISDPAYVSEDEASHTVDANRTIVNFSAKSNRPDLLTIAVNGSGASRTLSLTPQNNAYGSFLIYMEATDEYGETVKWTTSVEVMTNEPLKWYTTKDEVMAAAKDSGKLILIVYGRDTGSNATYFRRTVCETDDIKENLRKNYILWYANYDDSVTREDVKPYIKGMSGTLPFLVIVDPTSDTALKKRNGYTTVDAGRDFVNMDSSYFTYTVSAAANDANLGTVSGAGKFKGGTTCTLTANPASDCKFVAWMKDGVQVSTSNPYSFAVTESNEYTAVFEDTTPNCTIALNAGWNCIALAYDLDSDSREILLALSPMLLKSSQYVIATEADLEAGVALWVFSKNAQKLKLHGSEVSDWKPEIPLGWSMISAINGVEQLPENVSSPKIWTRAGYRNATTSSLPTNSGFWIYRKE